MDDLRDWLLHPRRTRTDRRRLARALEEDAKFRRTRDPIENEESTPPNDEEIRLRAVWMAESYPLSFADLLVDSVSQLTRDNPTVIGEAPGVQLEQALRSGRSGWIPLGTFVRPGHHRFVGSSPIEVPLPRDVDYGHGSLHFMLPSHIVLVSCFVLDEPGSRRVERALRANYDSHTVRFGRGLVTKTPANQKRDAVTTTRSQQLSEMAKFFHREAAGLFSNAGRDLPAVEFWTTKQRKPFDDNQRRSIHDFIQLLGWVTWIDVWQGPENLTVKEAPVRSDDYWTLPANLQIVAREHELFPRDDLAMYGGRSNKAFVNRLQDHIAPLVAALAVAETFRFYDSEVVASRRRLRDAQKQALHRRVKGVADVQDRLLQQYADVDALSRDVKRWSHSLLSMLQSEAIDFVRWLPPSAPGPKNAGADVASGDLQSRFRRRLARFSRQRHPQSQGETPRPSETLLGTLADEITSRAQHSPDGSREMTSVVRTISETTSAQANLRLQRQLAVLTWVLIALAIVTLFR